MEKRTNITTYSFQYFCYLQVVYNNQSHQMRTLLLNYDNKRFIHVLQSCCIDDHHLIMIANIARKVNYYKHRSIQIHFWIFSITYQKIVLVAVRWVTNYYYQKSIQESCSVLSRAKTQIYRRKCWHRSIFRIKILSKLAVRFETRPLADYLKEESFYKWIRYQTFNSGASSRWKLNVAYIS